MKLLYNLLLVLTQYLIVLLNLDKHCEDFINKPLLEKEITKECIDKQALDRNKWGYPIL
jgi:hypothetical protein